MLKLPLTTKQRVRLIQTVSDEPVLKWWDNLLCPVLFAISILAIGYFLYRYLLHENWSTSPIALSVLTIILVARLSMSQFHWILLFKMRKPKPMTIQSGWRVGVATTFVPSAESFDMLEETVKALVAMDYPHDTWVLDEGNDERVKAMCKRLGALHFSRLHHPEYQSESGTFQVRTKHGNYNAWLYEVGFDQYDIITGFDPDHIPHRDFLLQTLGYFNDPDVGYVQAAQAYYNQQASFIAYGAAQETYGYYSYIQMANYVMGHPIVTGCHNTHSSKALKKVGGFASHDADDLLLTLLYRTHGFRGVYVPKILARGLTPVDWSGYLTQQHRWARSVLDIKFRLYPKLAKALPKTERFFSYLHGFYYLRGLSTFASLLLLVGILITGSTPKLLTQPDIGQIGPLFLILQSIALYRQRFYLDRKNEIGIVWRAMILEYAKWPYFLLALCEVVINRRLPYALTNKTESRQKSRLLLSPHLVVAAVVLVAWIFGATRRDLPFSLEVWAGLIVFSSVVLFLTEFFNFPPPYERGKYSFSESNVSKRKQLENSYGD